MPWYVQVMGETLGPFPDAELVQMAAAGKIEPDTPVSQQSAGPWVPAAKVRGLFDAARGPGAAAEEPAAEREAAAAPNTAAAAAPTDEPSAAVTRPPGDGAYKVVTQRDPGFGGKFDPDKLEDVINSYASSGWKVCGIATTTFTTLAGKREEVIVLMERAGGAAGG